MTDKTERAMTVISRIEDTLASMQRAIEQERDGIGGQNWADVEELTHIAAQLDEIEEFWRERLV